MVNEKLVLIVMMKIVKNKKIYLIFVYEKNDGKIKLKVKINDSSIHLCNLKFFDDLNKYFNLF